MDVFQRMNQWFASSNEQELAHFELDSMEWERRVFSEEVEVGLDFFWDWDEDPLDHSTEEKWVYGFHEPELGLHFFVTKEKVKSPMAEDLAGLYPLDNLTEKQKEIYDPMGPAHRGPVRGQSLDGAAGKSGDHSDRHAGRGSA